MCAVSALQLSAQHSHSPDFFLHCRSGQSCDPARHCFSWRAPTRSVRHGDRARKVRSGDPLNATATAPKAACRIQGPERSRPSRSSHGPLRAKSCLPDQGNRTLRTLFSFRTVPRHRSSSPVRAFLMRVDRSVGSKWDNQPPSVHGEVKSNGLDMTARTGTRRRSSWTQRSSHTRTYCSGS